LQFTQLGDACHREYFFFGRIFFDFSAQAIDMGVDRVFVSVMPVPPNNVQQLGARVDFSGIASKMQQQIKFLCRQINRTARDVSTSFISRLNFSSFWSMHIRMSSINPSRRES
jgi:hypothetical protein